MTTIAAGASATVTLPQGQKLKTSGTGIAVLGPGEKQGLQFSLQGSNVLGPYDSNQVIYLTATGNLDYSLEADQSALPVARFTPDGTALVAPDGVILSVNRTWSSGLPFVMPSSGTINNTAGSVTVGTAFDYVIGPSYTFFPANALFASSPAGWYYTNWTAATIGTVYANTYANGIPSIPTTPTPLTTVAGAYTQSTGFDVIGPNVIVPGNAMGDNGMIEWQRMVNNNNSAGQKIYNTFFGGVNFQGLTQTTNPREAGAGSLKNRGRKTAQIGANAAHGDNNNASTLPKLSIDTSQNQIAAMAIQLQTATDYAIIESFAFRVTYEAHDAR